MRRPREIEALMETRWRVECPECGRQVLTSGAERVPAQSLRACNGCDAVFAIDWESTPITDSVTNQPVGIL